MENNLFQVIYISSATEVFDDEELPELLKVARENNATLDITGMLLYHERSFIQVLTGPKNKVEDLYNRIEKDPRHSDSQVLFRGDVEERSFEDWSMGFYKTTANTVREVPGLNKVLQDGFKGEDGEDRVRQVLSAFREGRWRQAVSA